MNPTSRFGFLTVLMSAVLAVLLWSTRGHVSLFQVFGSLTLLGGAVTINYLWPILGATPTQAQMQNFNMVIATVQGGAAGDTSAVVTHNFGLSAAEISQGMPYISVLQQANETTGIYELSENPNFTILGLPGVVGPLKVFLSRPHTNVR